MTLGDPTKGGRRPAELTRRATDMGTLLCPPSGVDLLVTKVGWTPANATPGTPVQFTATVTNFGTTTKAAGVINGVAFRVDGSFVSWSDNNTSALAPGQSVTVTANSGPSGTAFWNTTSGAHTVEGWVDDVNRVAETNENNNKTTAPLVAGIDLTVNNIMFAPTNFGPGQPVTFSATVKNEGNVATPAGTILGVRFEIDGQLVTWSDNNTQSLAPGATRTLTANSGTQGVASWTSTAGNHRLSAWVDDVNRIADVNRGNNKLTTRIP
jgi:subtilase family serine protease